MNKLACFGFAASFLLGCAAHDANDGHGHDDEKAAWEDAYEQAALGKADGAGCSGVWVPDQNGFSKRIALTFDDGPSVTTTPQVLDILAARGIKATFFINGNQVNSAAARAVVERTLAEGHLLANHSQTHKNFQKMTSSAERDAAVRLTNDVIQSFGVTPEYFRFPYGAATCNSIAIVEGYGLTVTGWNVDSGDWCYANDRGGVGYCHPATFEYVPNAFRHDMVAYTLSQIRSRNGGVVLFHDIHQHTVDHLETILDTLTSEGFSYTNIDDVATFPRLNGITPPFIGDPCETNADCLFEGGSCHRFTPSSGGAAGFCTAPCEGTCPDQSGKAPTFCVSLDGGVSGSCVSKAHQRNQQCAALPGTSAQSASRFIGHGAAAPATAQVCLPN